MNKELQDLAWSCLPKEFKEEVKKDYAVITENPEWDEAYNCALEETFGLHNLTSDAEGEEMLCVSRKQVQEAYKTSKEIASNEQYGTCQYSMHTQIMCVLENLFGSKCLRDDTKDDTMNDTKELKRVKLEENNLHVDGDLDKKGSTYPNICPSRLQIAAMAMQGYLSSHGSGDPKEIAIYAFAVADALIAETEKGGHNGED